MLTTVDKDGVSGQILYGREITAVIEDGACASGREAACGEAGETLIKLGKGKKQVSLRSE